ncbi:hypothetical protein KEM56_007146 [Ascosphaera pollenicola]|nr:hypothetical protein KEM56_007146 [Ascosphaera pollenicola]
MAPIRRYLRISEYSVLECRIYLSNPGDERWLDGRASVQPSSDGPSQYRSVIECIFSAIRPLILPKLREENARRLAGKKKSAPVKDVLVGDEFEVAIFLRETGTQHSLMARKKAFAPTGDTADASNPIEIRDEEEEPHVSLEDIPVDSQSRQCNQITSGSDETLSEGNGDKKPPAERKRTNQNSDDDKKLAASITYDGFSIWGWILCLLVTRRKTGKQTDVRVHQPPPESSTPSGASKDAQNLMEEWISTQVPHELVDDD